MKKIVFFIVAIVFFTVNIYAEENIFNRIFFGNFVKAGETFAQNPAVSFVFLSGAGLITTALMNNDLIIKNYFLANRTEFLDMVYDVFNMAGDAVTVLALNSFLFLFGEKERNTAEKVIEASVTAGTASYIIKITTGRQRPADTDDRYVFSPFSFKDSFPSGHATVAFAWATVISEQYGIWYITYPVAFMCGLARIYKNMHWASDVFFGSVIGTFFGMVVSLNQDFKFNVSTKIDRDIFFVLLNLKY